MQPPFARLIVTLLALPLLAHQAAAQEAGKVPGLDESKIPDWIKRQAASPQKAILNSTATKPKAERVEVVPVRVYRQAVRRQAAPAVERAASEPATPAGPELPLIETPELASSSPGVEGAAPAITPAAVPAPSPASSPAPAADAPASAPTRAPASAPSVAPADLTQPSPVAEPAAAAPPPTQAAEATALQLLQKTDPVLTADLLDTRLADASVTVAFTVGTQGEVIAPQIVASSDRRLNRAVLRAVAEWRYAPVSEPRPHSVKFSFAVTP